MDKSGFVLDHYFTLADFFPLLTLCIAVFVESSQGYVHHQVEHWYCPARNSGMFAPSALGAK